ncbi:MAG: hypothetical protein E7206_15800 [Clostridium beijerinckii]|nr:hypothetical protein [Clostridium beijerinckii]
MKFGISRGKINMKNKNGIGNLFFKLKRNAKAFIVAIFNFAPKDNIESFDYCKFRKLKSNDYEECRNRISIQMQRDRLLF